MISFAVKDARLAASVWMSSGTPVLSCRDFATASQWLSAA